MLRIVSGGVGGSAWITLVQPSLGATVRVVMVVQQCSWRLHPFSPQLPNHPLTPPGPEAGHSPNNNAASTSPNTNNGEEPAIPDSVDERLRDDGAGKAEDVAYEVVGGDTGAGAAGHELGEHGGGDAEDDHATEAEEEVGY